MLRLLDDLRNSPVPAETEETPLSLAELLGRASNELLQAKLNAEWLDSDGHGKLSVFASWLESYALVANHNQEEVGNALYLTGSIREFLLAREFAEGVTASTRLDLLSTVLVASSSSHPSIGMVLARRFIARIENQLDTADKAAFACIGALAAREFSRTITFYRRSATLAANADLTDVIAGDVAVMILLQRIAEASSSLAWALLFGDGTLADESRLNIEHLLQTGIQQAAFPPIGVYLGQRWLRVANALWETSSHRLLTPRGFSPSYLRRLVADGIISLWPHQERAIEAGLLEAQNFVAALPTGSGKSLLAELSLAQTLLHDRPGTWACYVVPTRALVHQVERDLSRRLAAEGLSVRSVLGGSEESGALTDELLGLTQPASITVTTPEKLEAYYRVSPESFSGLSQLVIDEAQTIGDTSRGPLLEQLTSLIRVQQPQSRILLLSAATSNPEDLAAWLGDAKSYYSTPIRLNRQELAVAVQLAAEPNVVHEYQYRGERRRTATVPGGLVTGFDLKLADLRGESLRASAVNAFEIQLKQKFAGDEWTTFDEASTAPEHARQVVQRFHASGETSIVFCATKESAKTQAEHLAAGLPDLPEDAPAVLIAGSVADYLGHEHALVGLMNRGVGYHHSLLPPMVQRLLERSLSEGWIRTLFTTSTLRDGVNLPARNCVVAGDLRYNEEDEKMREMAIGDFVNMAGRAGRPHLDTSGLAVLVPNHLREARRIGTRYFLYGADELAVRSALGGLAEALETSNDDAFTDLSSRDQGLLLSLYATGVRSQDELTEFFQRTLAFTQTGFDVDQVAGSCASRFTRLEQEVGPEDSAIIAKLGFGLSGASRVLTYAREHLAAFTTDAGPDFGDGTSRELLRLCLVGCSAVPELRVGPLKDDEIWQSGELFDLTELWLGGSTYRELAATPRFSAANDDEEAISRAVDFFGRVSQWLPWGVGAIQFVVRLLGEEPNSFITHLPLYLRFGLSTRKAALLSLVGVFDREIATRLAAEVPEPIQTASDLETWYRQLDLASVLGTDPRAYVLRPRRSDLNIWTLQFSADTSEVIKPVDCVIEREDDRYVARTLTGAILGHTEASPLLDRLAIRGIAGLAEGQDGELSIRAIAL